MRFLVMTRTAEAALMLVVLAGFLGRVPAVVAGYGCGLTSGPGFSTQPGCARMTSPFPS